MKKKQPVEWPPDGKYGVYVILNQHELGLLVNGEEAESFEFHTFGCNHRGGLIVLRMVVAALEQKFLEEDDLDIFRDMATKVTKN